MKKFFPALVLLSVLSVMLIPLAASAQTGPVECCKLRRGIAIDDSNFAAGTVVGAPAASNCPLGAIDNATEKWGIVCLINTLNAVVDWIFIVLVALAVLFVILGAINLLMSAGDPGKVTTGRNYILYAAVGLIVAFIARAVPAVVKAVMGF